LILEDDAILDKEWKEKIYCSKMQAYLKRKEKF
jgi:hypothetical protein